MAKASTTVAEKATKDESKEVTAQVSGTAVAAWDGIDVYADAGAGMEHVESRYLIIPQLRLLQSNSPQVKRSDAEYVQGSAEGMFFNTATAELFEKVLFIPCRFTPDYSEWSPGLQGDLIRSWGVDSTGFDESVYELVDGRSRFLHPNGNEFTQRAMFYGLTVKLDEDTGSTDFEKAVATLGGTSFAVARRWLTNITSNRITAPDGKKFVAPMWFRSFMVESAAQSNDSNSWMSWKVTPYADTLSLPGGKELYLNAKEFAHQVDKGEAKAAPEKPEPKPATGEDAPF